MSPEPDTRLSRLSGRRVRVTSPDPEMATAARPVGPSRASPEPAPPEQLELEYVPFDDFAEAL